MLDAGDGAVMKRADIKNLHVLIVGGKPHAVTILRTAFGIIGLNKVSAIAGSEWAIKHLRDETVDAVGQLDPPMGGDVGHGLALERNPQLLR